MKKTRYFLGIFAVLVLFSGCKVIEKEEEAETISFEIIEKDEIPEKMKAMIAEEKEQAFEIVYEEDGWLYVGQGYEKQKTEGYQIEIDRCAISEHFLYVHTILTGPAAEPKEKKPFWPYIVWRVKAAGRQVIFMN